MTTEILLIKKYSKLLNKISLENEVLREELIKALNDKNLHYESKIRWKLKYENLEKEVKKLCSTTQN